MLTYLKNLFATRPLKENQCALMCMAKDEDPYIDEWIDYHLALGFDKIFIYANDWNFKTKKKNVKVFYVQGKKQQIASFNVFTRKYFRKYTWAAFFDADEFLCLKKHSNLKEFLNDFSESECIIVPWTFFGDNGHTKVIDKNYSVLNRFTKREDVENDVPEIIQDQNIPLWKRGGTVGSKSIVRLNIHKMPIWTNQHAPNNFETTIPTNDFSEKPEKKIDVVQLNHYFVKTLEEYTQIRMKRGRPEVPNNSIDWMKFYKNRNLNEVEDTIARDFMRQCRPGYFIEPTE